MRSKSSFRAYHPISAIILLTATLYGSLASAQELGDDTVAIVNGQPISQFALDAVMMQLQQSGQPADEAAIINELVNLEMLTQKAEAQKLQERDDIKTLLRLQYTQMLARTYMGDLSREIVISDEDVQAAYDELVANSSIPEFRASHILLDDEASAKEVIQALKDGGSFEDLARERSTGPSGETGGDLGWFQAESMVPEFSAAVSQMTKDSISEAPVQTQFGWHVIKLVDKRDTNVPTLDAVSEDLRTRIIGQRLTDQVSQFRQEADIKIRE